MKRINTNTPAYVTLVFLAWLIFYTMVGCHKVGVDNGSVVIDLGTKSTTTAIKSISQVGNTVTIEFSTTVGSKYSVQITPFGSDSTVKSEGFTATDTVTKKVYTLDGLAKRNYDLHFLDVNGKEDKHPITIK